MEREKTPGYGLRIWAMFTSRSEEMCSTQTGSWKIPIRRWTKSGGSSAPRDTRLQE